MSSEYLGMYLLVDTTYSRQMAANSGVFWLALVEHHHDVLPRHKQVLSIAMTVLQDTASWSKY